MKARREERGPWYLLTGLILGLALGLAYAWMFQPAETEGTAPSGLNPEAKQHYRAMIAAAYQADGDLLRARARLELLGDQDVYHALAEQAQQMLASGETPDQARALGMLAVALGQSQSAGPTSQPTTPAVIVAHSGLTPLASGMPPPSASPLPASASPTATAPPASTPTPMASEPAQSTAPVSTTPAASATDTADSTEPSTTPGETVTPTPKPRPTETPRPTATASPTPGGPFVLTVREEVCTAGQPPRLQIQTYDGSGQPVPGLEIVVTWEGGEEHFFTGLKPELGLGYADFNLTPGVNYTVRVAQAAQIIDDLQAVACPAEGGGEFWGGWQLRYEQR